MEGPRMNAKKISKVKIKTAEPAVRPSGLNLSDKFVMEKFEQVEFERLLDDRMFVQIFVALVATKESFSWSLVTDDNYQVPLYDSIIDFFEVHNLTVGRNEEWRLTDRILGEINGLPGSRGFLTATNGILCYVEQHGRLFGPAHIGWFITEKQERVRFNKEKQVIEIEPQPRKSKMLEMVKDLV
jgi:hypothetical protein